VIFKNCPIKRQPGIRRSGDHCYKTSSVQRPEPHNNIYYHVTGFTCPTFCTLFCLSVPHLPFLLSRRGKRSLSSLKVSRRQAPGRNG